MVPILICCELVQILSWRELMTVLTGVDGGDCDAPRRLLRQAVFVLRAHREAEAAGGARRHVEECAVVIVLHFLDDGRGVTAGVDQAVTVLRAQV